MVETSDFSRLSQAIERQLPLLIKGYEDCASGKSDAIHRLIGLIPVVLVSVGGCRL